MTTICVLTHQTSKPGRLWCGVEVEAYWCYGAGNRKRHIYVRAHATRNTSLREQKNKGIRVATVARAKTLAKKLFRSFRLWEQARRTKSRRKLTEPWTRREIETLRRISEEPPRGATLRFVLQRKGMYDLAERLCVKGNPLKESRAV